MFLTSDISSRYDARIITSGNVKYKLARAILWYLHNNGKNFEIKIGRGSNACIPSFTKSKLGILVSHGNTFKDFKGPSEQ